MVLTEEATIGLLSLLVTAVIALGTLISWLLRQHHRRRINRTTRRQQDLEDGTTANDSQPTLRHEPQSVVSSAHLGTAATQSLGATAPLRSAQVMLATLATSSASGTVASDFRAPQAVTSASSAG